MPKFLGQKEAAVEGYVQLMNEDMKGEIIKILISLEVANSF